MNKGFRNAYQTMVRMMYLVSQYTGAFVGLYLIVGFLTGNCGLAMNFDSIANATNSLVEISIVLCTEINLLIVVRRSIKWIIQKRNEKRMIERQENFKLVAPGTKLK